MADVVIAQATERANRVEWAKLALTSSQARVLRLTRIRHDATGRPLLYEEIVLPLDRFSGLSPNGAEIPDIIGLAQHHGLSLSRAMERVSIVPATNEVASHLVIAVGTHVLKMDRLVETTDGEPVEWRVAYKNIG